MSTKIPDQAQVVVIGGGIVGCSVAYHLTKLRWGDVLVLERKEDIFDPPQDIRDYSRRFMEDRKTSAMLLRMKNED